MRRLRVSFLLAVLTILAVSTVCASASNITLKIKNDKRRVIDFGVFGYGGPNEGRMELKVLDFLIHDLDEYDSIDEKIGFALDLVPSAGYARKERNTAIKRTKVNSKSQGQGGSADDDLPDAAASPSTTESENLCFVDDPSFVPETRYLLPLQESLVRMGRKVEKSAATNTMSKVQKANALRALAKNLSATISVKPDRPGFYALFFYNCKKANRNKTPVPITFKVRISQYNVLGNENDGQYVSYLSYGDTQLPEIYLFAFIVFAALTTVWHMTLSGSGVGGLSTETDGKDSAVKNKAGKQSNKATSSAPTPPPKLIHKLMYALVVLKCLSLFFEAVMLSRRRSSGKLSAAVDYIFYSFQAVKGFFLFTTILLLGSGWSLLKPFLSDRDRKIMLLLLPLQLIVNVAIAVIGESSEGSKYWSWWRDMLRLVDVGCCVAVLLPVITSIHSLRSTTDRAEQRRLGRLRQFRTFYIVLVGYMFITRVVLDYVVAIAPYYLTWAPAVIGELGALFLYIVAGYMFRPAAQAEWEKEERISAADIEEGEELTFDNDSEVENDKNVREGEEDADETVELVESPITKQTKGKKSKKTKGGKKVR